MLLREWLEFQGRPQERVTTRAEPVLGAAAG
jgi:hypothetical protein